MNLNLAKIPSGCGWKALSLKTHCIGSNIVQAYKEKDC
jgi:hypothetical protein